MSINSTMINDRYCWNCLAEHVCDSSKKDNFNGYCISWTPTKIDRSDAENNDYELQIQTCCPDIIFES